MKAARSQQLLGLALIGSGLIAAGVGLQQSISQPLRSAPKAVSTQPDLEPCRVLFVTDGDTVACDLNGNGRYDKPVERVRFLGIDTPEMHYSRKNPTYGSQTPTDEPFAKESSALTEALVKKGQTIYLEYDLNRADPRGRTLAYVYLDAEGRRSIAEEQLRKGYAEVLFFKPNLRHYARYQAIEDTARQQGVGRWGGN